METTMLWLLIIVVMGIVVASKDSTSRNPGRVTSINVEASPSKVFDALTDFPNNSKFELHEVNRSLRRIVLKSGANWTSWGFFYRISVTGNDNSASIEIGIQSKALQIGPFVGTHQKSFQSELVDYLASRGIELAVPESSHVTSEGGIAARTIESATSLATELTRLGELRDSGVISDSEFKQAKLKLLK